MTYLGPVVAVVVGIVHAALAPALTVAGVKPNLILIAVVLVACLYGFLPGATWAFAGGLAVNLLVGEPLGSVPLSLLLVAAVVAAGSRVVGRSVWIFPVLAALAGSLMADTLTVLISSLVSDRAPAPLPTNILLTAAALNAAVTGLLLYPARRLAAAHLADEAPAW